MIISFDIGGTAIKGAVVQSAEQIVPLARRPTPIDDFDAFVETLRAVIAEGGETPDCIAISIAGVLDPDTQAAIVANIPCIHGRQLQAELQQALGYPVIVANDADCFAMAEAGIGAGVGHRIVFGIILGTGVGGGIVADGRLINAAGGFAGEWGHGPVAPAFAGQPPVAIPVYQCGCGQRGCIDHICSARGMERLHRHFFGQQMTSEEIIDSWLAGDADAAKTIEILVDILASPLALAINITGATSVPVGGGLSNVPKLLDAIDTAVRSRILRKFDRPLVVAGSCRVEPGLIGAALLGLQKVEHDRHSA
jgi:N-acetylglucosamine kinase